MPKIKVISGAQTGVDRAALDVAIALGIPHGGTCPKLRKAEDGPIPAQYQLDESNSPSYRVRTRQNILDAHGTLILHQGPLSLGTKLTRDTCLKAKKPLLMVDLSSTKADQPCQYFRDFMDFHFIAILNIAGPRASVWRNGYPLTFQYLKNNLSYYLAP